MRIKLRGNQRFPFRLWGRRGTQELTCPRCHTQYEGIGCVQCGWVSDTSVAYCGTEGMQEGKAIA
ncbi:MAG: hypothetical protein ACYC63_12950 [Armatimonadota bacterium]